MTQERVADGSLALSNLVRQILLPIIIPVLVGIGSAAITTTITTARLEERVSHLENKFVDHNRVTEELRTRDNDYERRISRAEALAEETQRRLGEIASDVKTLLKMERMQP